MKKILIGLLITLGVLVIVCFMIFGWITGAYNNFINQQEVVKTSWSQVETQYQRRFDLIPNLVEATKGYLKQEQTIFKAIADARTRYAGTPSGTDEKVQAASQLDGALARLLVIIENYPNLKSDQTVQSLMDELAGTENRISVARQRYNDQVKIFNVSIKVFPRNILASIFGFKEKPFFQSEENADKAIPVDLNL